MVGFCSVEQLLKVTGHLSIFVLNLKGEVKKEPLVAENEGAERVWIKSEQLHISQNAGKFS